jgi:hypothetical protein
MRHVASSVACLSPIDYADSLCAWVVDSLFYWDQSLYRRGLGPVLAARLRTPSQRRERRGTPKLEDADSVAHRSVLRRNVELFVSLWLYWIWTLLFLVLMESMGDRPAYPSGLFGLLEPTFVARIKTTFIGISEIILANSLIGAVCLFPLAIIFRSAFRRGHVTQLGISPFVQDQSEDDD